MKRKPTPQESFLNEAKEAFPNLQPRAARAAHWMTLHLVCSKGQFTSQPFELTECQLDLLNGVFGVGINDPLIITRIMMSMARKNGKTEFASALSLLHLMGPEAVPGSTIICAAAANRDQAAHVWRGARLMIEQSPTLSKHYDLKKKAAANRIHITTDYIRWKHKTPTGAASYSHIKTVSTSAKAVQGELPKVFFFDEIAELAESDRELYDGLHYSQQSGGLGYILTTRSTNTTSLFNSVYQDVLDLKKLGMGKEWFVQMFSADPESPDLLTWENLMLANPNMHLIGEEVLRADLQQAKESDQNRISFIARRLNLSSSLKASLVDPTIWQECASPASIDELFDRYEGKRAVLGLDLGNTSSLTALAVYWPDEKYVCSMNWMARMSLEDNIKRHSQIHYKDWVEQGHLHLVEDPDDGGIDYVPIAKKIEECYRRFDVLQLRYDGWNKHRLWTALASVGMRKEQYPLADTLTLFQQGALTYGETILEFEDMMATRSLRHDDNPVSNAAVNLCEVEIAPSMSNPMKKPVKHKNLIPNDAAMSILMAIADFGLYSDLVDQGTAHIKKWYTRRGTEADAPEKESDTEADAHAAQPTARKGALLRWMRERSQR